MKSSLVLFFFGVIAFFCLSKASASVISCPPNGYYQDVNPKISQICMAIEQALSDSSSPKENNYFSRMLDERNTNLNAKRQDVDHVFLRFGRAGL
ncbi:myosuppressin isoform X2 [Sitophilus oryzae]|nr:myosuppressin isoform X2 [Sitophilus oryzae]